MYGKLFRQIYHGTLATTGPWQALVTFQQMIVLADREGVVDMTAEAISRETTVPLEIIKIGIAALEQPDPDSRTPDEEGRRIIRLSDDRQWGWRVTNYKHYRDLRREEDRREYHRRYWHKRKGNNLNVSTGTQHTQPNQPIAEAYAEAKAEAVEGATPPRASRAAPAKLSEEIAGLDLIAWERWMTYRAEIKKPIRQASVLEAAKKLAAYGEQQQAVVAQSIANGWQGLFDPKDTQRKSASAADRVTWRPD